MTLSRRRKATPAGLRLDRLRQARVNAPTLREFLPAATQVLVELTFAGDARLAQGSHAFTVFPPAQAHFVYACAFGDCDGTFDLNDRILGMLREQSCRSTDVLHCAGHRTRREGPGLQCGLSVAYAVTVGYLLARHAQPAQLLAQ
jgi:hypothetical protein